MATKILVHGFGHKAASWDETVSRMADGEAAVCPDLSSLLEGKRATYENLASAFAQYCSGFDGPIHLCGLSLGGVLALQFALDFPQKVKTLVLIGTPCKIPKAAFRFQNAIFRFLPKSVFETMAFDKKDSFALLGSMTNLDFSDRIQNIQCPTLVLCGEKDRANRASADFLSQNIRNAELKIIENAGHVVNEENPKALAELLHAFYL